MFSAIGKDADAVGAAKIRTSMNRSGGVRGRNRVITSMMAGRMTIFTVVTVRTVRRFSRISEKCSVPPRMRCRVTKVP